MATNRRVNQVTSQKFLDVRLVSADAKPSEVGLASSTPLYGA